MNIPITKNTDNNQHQSQQIPYRFGLKEHPHKSIEKSISWPLLDITVTADVQNVSGMLQIQIYAILFSFNAFMQQLVIDAELKAFFFLQDLY